jgi:hypothetical protein
MTKSTKTTAAPKAMPQPAAAAPAKAPKGKIAILIGLLERSDGATTADLMAATGWQAHSVRGAIAGSIKKTLGLTVLSEKSEAGRVYRIVADATA